MFTTKNEQTAQKLAHDHGSYYGFSVFQPKAFYVGSVDELLRIGVAGPINPVDVVEDHDDVPANDWKGSP